MAEPTETPPKTRKKRSLFRRLTQWLFATIIRMLKGTSGALRRGTGTVP